jgi:hypothetical protein
MPPLDSTARGGFIMQRPSAPAPTVHQRLLRTASAVAIAATLLTRPAGAQSCTGDCNGDDRVAVDELVTLVRIALGEIGPDRCGALAAGLAAGVTVDAIVLAVDYSIRGCPGGTPLPTRTPSATVAATATATPTPTLDVTSTPTIPAAVCGNGIPEVEQGETCDDGNTDDGDLDLDDACPFDCRLKPLPCTLPRDGLKVEVAFDTPGRAALFAASVFLRYPDGTVDIAGAGSGATMSVTVSSLDAQASVNDLDYALRVLLSALAPFPADPLFVVQFRDCGDPPANLAAFRCTVVEAFDDQGEDITSATTCRISIVP